MKTVLVIGSNSFSGSDFIDLLLEKRNYRVVGVSRSAEKSALFLPYKKRNSPLFYFFQIDLNKDLRKLEKIIQEFHPSYIVNFAAQSEVAPSWEHPHHWFQTNAVALTKLISILNNISFIEKYMHISSPEVYGSCNGFISENAPLHPSTPYAASKAAGDLSLFTFYKNFRFPLTIIRATNVYGAYQQLFKIIPRSIISIKKGNSIALHGGGEAIKSYIHIRDVSLGELAVMEKGNIGEVYHISPNKGVKVKQVVAMIANQMNVPFDKVTKQVKERLGQDKAYTIDSSKIRSQLSWEPTISLKAGIEQTIGWVLKNFTAIQTHPLEYQHKP